MNAGDNYGQRMHGLLKAPLSGNYIFWISSDDSSHLHLSSDENPDNVSMIAYVNGYTGSRQWNKFPATQQSASVFLQAGYYYYIRALMKEGGGGDNLAVRWQLPDGTLEEPIPAERIFVNTQELHTNFAISVNGETLQLTMPDGTGSDSVGPVVLFEDISYGRSVDGGPEWVFYKHTTPNASNNLSAGYTDALLPPVFSQQGGFSADPFELALSSPVPDVVIHYTLDGSEPDENSPVYTGPILIAHRDHEQNRSPILKRHRNLIPLRSIHDYVAVLFKEVVTWMPPPQVKKATVVRAMAVKAGAIPVIQQPIPIGWVGYRIAIYAAVVSLNTNADNLFDPSYGIYVPGQPIATAIRPGLGTAVRPTTAIAARRGSVRRISLFTVLTERCGWNKTSASECTAVRHGRRLRKRCVCMLGAITAAAGSAIRFLTIRRKPNTSGCCCAIRATTGI
jgi:hypothetical protein